MCHSERLKNVLGGKLGERLLGFGGKSQNRAGPIYFLSVVSSDRFGALRFEGSDRSRSPTPIAVSRIGEEQEAMLLMKAGDWVRSALGVWQLTVAPNLRHGASLQLLEDAVIG